MSRSYLVTTVYRQRTRNILVALLADALPHLAWRHHGIGVLQAYLAEGDVEVRAHIWHPDLLRHGQDNGQIHDHRFALRSSVLVGAVHHDEYHLTEDDDGAWWKYAITNARRGGIAQPAPERLPGAWRAEIVRGVVSAGEAYVFPEGEFHRSHVDGLTVTVVTKTAQRDRRAILLVPSGSVPKGLDAAPVDIAHYVEMARAALIGGAL